MQEIVKPYLKESMLTIDDLPPDARLQIEQLRSDFLEQVKSFFAKSQRDTATPKKQWRGDHRQPSWIVMIVVTSTRHRYFVRRSVNL